MTATDTLTKLPQCWQDVQDAMDSGIDRIILFGPPGTGKTFAGLHIGNVEAGAHRLVCTEDMTTADVTGCFIQDEKGGYNWQFGSAMKAWRGNGVTGGRLVVDEIDKAGGDVAAQLLAMLDSPESASWEHPSTGERFTPTAGFSAVMTTNIEDMRELPTALADRFPVSIRINQPHPSALKRLSPDLRELAIRSADAGERRISLRAFYDFDKIRTNLGIDRAAQMVFKDRAQSILDAIAIESVAR
jgi:MoxR-like ATPase